MNKETIIDSITHDGQISVCVITYTDDSEGAAEDESPIELERLRVVISPGDYKTASQWLPTDLYEQAVSAWTPEIISAWEAQQAALWAEFESVPTPPPQVTADTLIAALMEGYANG